MATKKVCQLNRKETKEIQTQGQHDRQGKARQVYLFSTFHTQWKFKVLYIEELKQSKQEQLKQYRVKIK